LVSGRIELETSRATTLLDPKPIPPGQSKWVDEDNQLRIRKGDDFFNDCRVTYMESDIFDSGKNEKYLTTHSKYEVTYRAININIVILQY